MLRNEVCVGIDLGTAYCCLYYYDLQRDLVVPLRFSTGETTIASTVDFIRTPVIVGSKSNESIADIKRLIGLAYDDPKAQKEFSQLTYEYSNNEKKQITPLEVSAVILNFIKRQFVEITNSEITKAVITVPAYFGDNQRRETELAAKIAGINVIKLVNEPTAAAFAYGLQKNRQTNYFGSEDNNFNVIAIGGNDHLGGIDIDRNTADLILELWEEELSLISEEESSTLRDRFKIKQIDSPEIKKKKHKKVKIELSTNNSCTINLADYNLSADDIEIEIELSQFEEKNQKIFEECKNVVANALESCSHSIADIVEVVMVGGSSRIPAIVKMMQNEFGKGKINTKINCNEVVAMGAALMAKASVYDEGEFVKPNELIAHSISIESIDLNETVYNCEVIAPNTPCNALGDNHHFAVKEKASQTDAYVVIKEDGKRLGTFQMNNLGRDDAVIDITIEIDGNGALLVKGKCGTSVAQVAVNPAFERIIENLGNLEYNIDGYFK
ncbi:Heat shock protein 70 [Entamoeba marina]